VRSSRGQVFPMENVPLAFSFDLWTRTLPDFLTAMIITRRFSDCGLLSCGGGGPDGWLPNSVILKCVIYVSATTHGVFWSAKVYHGELAVREGKGCHPEMPAGDIAVDKSIGQVGVLEPS